MPTREPKPALFKRWLLLVYLPLGTFILCVALALGNLLNGAILWLVGLLGLYCVIPARLIIETQRKGLELPKPPGAQRGRVPSTRLEKVAPASRPRTRKPAPRPVRRETVPLDEPDEVRSREEAAGEEMVEDFTAWRQRGDGLDEDDEERPARRPVAAAEARTAKRVTERAERTRPTRPKKSPQVVRRRALASIVGIGALLGLGGILVIIGIGKVTSSFGLVMVGVGGFLMILSVTLPTFRLVDAALRGIGRLISRRPSH